MARAAQPTKSAKPASRARQPDAAPPATKAVPPATKKASAPPATNRKAAAKAPVTSKNSKASMSGKAAKPAATSRTAKPLVAAKQVPKQTTKSAPAAAPKPSKDDLRLQVDKLEQTLATMRSKNKKLVAATKEAQNRIAELEAEIVRLGSNAKGAPAKTVKPTRPAASSPTRKPRERDPGDAVPPGVAAQNSVVPDVQAETARESLEANLSGE